MRTAAKRPRVVIASRGYPPEVGAAAFRIRALADALARPLGDEDGVDVTVLTSRPPRGTETSVSENVRTRVRRWPVLRDRTGNVRGYLSYASFDVPLLLRLLFARADAIVAEAPPTTGVVAVLIGRLRRRPVVYYPGDVWTDAVIAMGGHPLVVRTMRFLETRILRRAHRVLAVSPEVAQRFVDMGADAARVVMVGNGIDTSVFSPYGESPRASRPYFAYTGTMSDWQRPELFVKALALIASDTDVELRFFGQGTAASGVADAARTAGLTDRVHLGGVVSPDEAAAWLRGAVAALVSIVPGVGYDFARPTKTYAAAATGAAVLYAGAPSGAEVVRSAELGYAVGFDAVEVAAAMTHLLDDASSTAEPEARKRRSGWARDHASLDAVARAAAAPVLAMIAR